MKKKPKPGEIRFDTPPDEYARTAESQRTYTLDLADQVEKGEPLTDALAIKWVAGILRAWADQIPNKQPRGPGNPQSKIDHGNVAIHYAILVNGHGMKKSVAIANLAERNDVSDETIKAAVKKYGAAALAFAPKKHKELK